MDNLYLLKNLFPELYNAEKIISVKYEKINDKYLVYIYYIDKLSNNHFINYFFKVNDKHRYDEFILELSLLCNNISRI